MICHLRLIKIIKQYTWLKDVDTLDIESNLEIITPRRVFLPSSAKRRAVSPMSTSTSTSSEPRHGPYRGRWLYGTDQYENVLGHRLPSFYGQRDEPTRALPSYKVRPM